MDPELRRQVNEPVRVSFNYTPDEPDPDDSTGLSSEEYETLTERLMTEYGAEDIRIEKKQ